MAEHFEAHGNRWEAFNYFGGDENFTEVISNGIQKGVIDNKGTLEDKSIVTICHPPNNDISLCSLIEKTNKGNVFASMYPLMEGIPYKLLITAKYTWKNGIEGEIECKYPGTFNLSFFAPYYVKQFKNIELCKRYKIFLAGLAYMVENDTRTEFKIDKGDFYKIALKTFLEDNPNKTKKDFPYATVGMRNVSILLPTKYVSELEYRGPILDIEYTELLGVKIVKTKIRIVRTEEDENGLIINLYIPEPILNGYTPKIDDCIKGVMWLTGYME
ncbi:MAG: hypothetical protein LBT79_01870 [Elusimicrobiota bacterium]|jgi:hypothetical protein|nr:hypothetical protein [Elusimicrobiota bacterium]